jgi:hypothetical protein
MSPVDYLAELAVAEAIAARDRQNGHSTIPCGLPATPAFPIDVLPPAVRVYVTVAAASLNTPCEMVAMPLLGFAGALIGNRAHLIVKNSWREFPTLYVAIVAPPGSAKTPALDLAKWPLAALQKVAHEMYRTQLATYEAAMETWRATGQKEGEPKPVPPELRHYFSTDLTVEALAGMLSRSPGVAVARDELTGWIAAMDQYKGGKGSDRQQFLSLWSSQTLKVDRKGGGSVYVQAPVACVVGGIQPDLAGDLLDAAQRRDGFVERVCPYVPDVGPALWTEEAPSAGQYLDLVAVFQTLDRLAPPTADESEAQSLAPGIGVELSPEAKKRWVSWVNENARLVADADGLAAGFYAKLPAHVARFALILHALWNPEDLRPMLSETRMVDAIELGEFLRVHIGRFLSLLKVAAPPASAGISTRIVRILQKAIEEGPEGRVTRSDLLRRLGNVKTDDLSAALQELLDDGAVERREHPTDTKPAEEWRLVPAVNRFDGSKYLNYSPDDALEPGEKANCSNTSNGVEKKIDEPAWLVDAPEVIVEEDGCEQVVL